MPKKVGLKNKRTEKVSYQNACSPVRIKNSMAPMAQISTGFPYFSRLSTSGAIYPAVPAWPYQSKTPFGAIIAKPKSAIFITPDASDSSSIFVGFKSI